MRAHVVCPYNTHRQIGYLLGNLDRFWHQILILKLIHQQQKCAAAQNVKENFQISNYSTVLEDVRFVYVPSPPENSLSTSV